MHLPLILTYLSTAAAICPMGELTRRGLAPADMQENYLQGRGLGTPNQKRQANDPPVADPIGEILSPLGLGSLTPSLSSIGRAQPSHRGAHSFPPGRA